jgi:hydroxymethylpyrimidine pyrophosphatase-like HAD family hydrolase
MLPKLVFHDIDGCLNSSDGAEFSSGADGRLTPNQEFALENLGAECDRLQIHLVLNTGRNLKDSLHIAKGLKCNGLQFALLEHGAYAWDFRLQQEVDLGQIARHQGDVARSQRYESLKLMEDLLCWYRSEGRIFLSQRLQNEAPQALEKKFNLSLEVPVGGTPQALMENLKYVVSMYYPNAQAGQLQYCHSHFFVDILGPIHKADGAFILARHLECSPQDCLVVGDGMNDMDMFSQWPQVLCPANAYSPLKELCHRVGGTVSSHAYSEATLKHLALLSTP